MHPRSQIDWSYRRLLLFLEGVNCYSWCCWLEQGLGLVVFEVLDQAGIYWPSLLGVQAHRGMSVRMEEDLRGGRWNWWWLVQTSNLTPSVSSCVPVAVQKDHYCKQQTKRASVSASVFLTLLQHLTWTLVTTKNSRGKQKQNKKIFKGKQTHKGTDCWDLIRVHQSLRLSGWPT